MPRATATLRPSPWRWPRPRVLVEHPDEAMALAIAMRLRRAGCAVAVCPGPNRPGECPLTGADGCAAAEGADLVVSCLGEADMSREVVHALRTRCSSVPVVDAAPNAVPAAVAAVAVDVLGARGEDVSLA